MACLHLLLPDLGSVPAYEAGFACVQESLRERQVSLSTSMCASVFSKSILSHMHSMVDIYGIHSSSPSRVLRPFTLGYNTLL